MIFWGLGIMEFRICGFWMFGVQKLFTEPILILGF